MDISVVARLCDLFNFVFCVATLFAEAYIKQLAGDCVNRLLERCLLFTAEFNNALLQPPVSAKS